MQIFSRLLIARDKRVREIGKSAKNPCEGEFPSIFRGKESFRPWHTSPKEGGGEEETNQFFRIFVWVKQTRFHYLAYLANRHRSFLQQKTKMWENMTFLCLTLTKKVLFGYSILKYYFCIA